MIGTQAQKRLLRVLRETVLTVGAIAGTLCLVFTLLGPAAGVRTLVFTSGSMSPTIETGDLAITRPVEVAKLTVGDVVSVVDDRGVRITHRVVEVDAGKHLLVLKGDANEVADPQPYRADRVDRVVLSVPAAGYLLTWLSSPMATVLIGVYLAFLLWVLLPRRKSIRSAQPEPAQESESESEIQPLSLPLLQPHPQRQPRSRDRHGSHRRAGTTFGVALAIAVAAGGTPQPEPTLAAWTDPGPITGTILAAYTVPKPVITGCSVSGVTVTVTWTAVSSPYALTYRAAVGPPNQAADQQLTVASTGSSRSTTYTTVLQSLVGGTRTIRITAALPSTPTWNSVDAIQVVQLGVLLGLGPSCGASS